MRRTSLLAVLVLLACRPFAPGEVVLRPDARALPDDGGPTPLLRYHHPAASNVMVAGDWDRWAGRTSMQLQDGVWVLDVRPLAIPFGRHEYKFIIDGDWEKGDNRFFYANAEFMLERPSDLIRQALIQDLHTIEVFLAKPVPAGRELKVWIEPAGIMREWHLASPAESGHRQGYEIAGGLITFFFDARTYGLDLPPTARVFVAGNFNGWNSADGRWQLQNPDGDHVWELTAQLPGMRPPPGEQDLLFKFVMDGNRWLPPPPRALNAALDGKGNVNLRIDPRMTGGTTIRIAAGQPLDLSGRYIVAVDGLQERTARAMVTPGDVMAALVSGKELGAILERKHGATTYRLFAPRATGVDLCLFDTFEHQVHQPAYRRLEPAERYPLWRDPEDGVWEISLLGLDVGRYYMFMVDGPSGEGEGFDPFARVGDPYARAAAHAENNAIVMDPEAVTRWFGGWSDQEYVQREPQDVVLYEAHVRDLTMHPSSGVAPELRGTYEGILASEGTGTGLDHLRDLGVNTIEIMPIGEFNNGPDGFNWGYSTVFYFAPEASYARAPLTGSQYYEFKRLVNELHRRGFGVVLDVVYNHVGSPNFFHLIDKKYFFRLNPDYTYSNFSGCGNDVRTEAPMMRRLIVDNILYWMREHHVDGFRFDLAELIDMDTMLAIRDAARALNPKVLLISEPWSFRGENKHQLKGSGWSAWNNDFRYAAKGYVMGERNRDWLRKNIFGSVETWAADPRQPVNYLESHDDMALADELCTRPNRDGRELQEMDVSANRLAATVLFTSLGIPMLTEGQEFLRSKRGLPNTYDKGDEVNALRWTERDRPLAAEALAYYRGLIQLRLSPQGTAFRVRERPPDTYYRWIMAPNERGLGYIVNADHIHAGAAFVVLLNAAGEDADFRVAFPPGTWRMIADGRRLDPAGLPEGRPFQGPAEKTVSVPPIRSMIFMDGF